MLSSYPYQASGTSKGSCPNIILQLLEKAPSTFSGDSDQQNNLHALQSHNTRQTTCTFSLLFASAQLEYIPKRSCDLVLHETHLK